MSLESRAQQTAGGWGEIGPADAAPELAGIRVIDVRETHEYVGQLGHISGAELVPLGGLLEEAPAWNREAPLLLVCRSGGRSAHAAQALGKLGFTTLYNLTGGMLAWNAAGLPVDR